jgi:hypothetical protein
MRVKQLRSLIADMPDDAVVVVCNTGASYYGDECVAAYVTMVGGAGLVLLPFEATNEVRRRHSPWDCHEHDEAKDNARRS